MTQAGYVLLGLTAIVGSLAGILAFAVMNFFAAARKAAKGGTPVRGEAVFMAAAMEDALQAVKAQELAMKARAEASERLSSEIIASMTSGLLVVSEGGLVRTLNPAGRRLLGLAGGRGCERDYREVLASAAPLSDVVDECLRPCGRSSGAPCRWRSRPAGATHLGITVSPSPRRLRPAARRDLPVHRSQRSCRSRRAAAAQGQPGAARRAHRRHRARVPQWPGDDPRLRPPARPRSLQPDFARTSQGIRDETEALGQVVTNFLNFAKPTDLTLTPVDMQGIVDRAAEEIRSDARTRGGDVTVTGRFGRVEGDEVLLRQAFSNLCRNALEACTDANVPPRIAIEGRRMPPRTSSGSRSATTGPGIKPGAAAKIFTPFFTTKARGTGLGLALVQKIIVTHNGRITAANARAAAPA